MHSQRTLLLIAAAVGAVANFLPWVSTPFRSFSGADIAGSDGWITMSLSLLALAPALSGDRRFPTGGGARTWLFLIGALVALIAIHDIASMNDKIGDNQYVSVGIGLYLTAGAGIVLAFGGVAFRAGAGAAATLPVAATWPPAPPPPPPPCATCGASLIFVPQYQRLYCHTCARYA